MRHPAVIYADIECFSEDIETCSPNDKQSYTKQYQKHTPSEFCLKLVCADGIDHEPAAVLYTKLSKNDDVVEAFIEAVEEEIKNFYNALNFPKR